jgi:hypothetical protein
MFRTWLLQPLLEVLAMNQAEILSRLQELDGAIAKIGLETGALIADVAKLQAALDAAGGVNPDVVAALDALTARVKAVDDLVPDVAPAP